MAHDANTSLEIRRTRRTLQLVAALYVVLGLVVSATGAVMGDRLAAFLGFLIVGGALGTAAALNMLFRVVHRATSEDDTLVEIKKSLARIEAQVHAVSTREADAAAKVRILNLASVGGGDPSVLAAATLDRDVYPRLVTSMGLEESDTPPPHLNSTSDSQADFERTGISAELDAPAVAAKDMWRVWGAAMRSGDLPTCRKVFAALVDVADEEAVSNMSDALDALADRHEQRLRAAFGKFVRAADFAAALRTGDEICLMFPNHPLSEEFLRIKPILERKAALNSSNQHKRCAAST